MKSDDKDDNNEDNNNNISGHIGWNSNLLADESDKNSDIGKETESDNRPVHEDETVLGQRSYPECIGIDVLKKILICDSQYYEMVF